MPNCWDGIVASNVPTTATYLKHLMSIRGKVNIKSNYKVIESKSLGSYKHFKGEILAVLVLESV